MPSNVSKKAKYFGDNYNIEDPGELANSENEKGQGTSTKLPAMKNVNPLQFL